MGRVYGDLGALVGQAADNFGSIGTVRVRNNAQSKQRHARGSERGDKYQCGSNRNEDAESNESVAFRDCHDWFLISAGVVAAIRVYAWARSLNELRAADPRYLYCLVMKSSLQSAGWALQHMVMPG